MKIDILSPHQDDAAFSVALTIDALTTSRCDVRIVNVFTVSLYAPLLRSQSVQQVSLVRRNEDRAFAGAFGERVTFADLDRADAPVRDPSHPQLLRSSRFTRAEQDEIKTIASRLSQLWTGPARPDVILLPLALGNHIDHRIALAAAVRARRRHATGFFEDIPYTDMHSEKSICARARRLASFVRSPLQTVLIGAGGKAARTRKRQLVQVYRSQLSRRMRCRIWRRNVELDGCERLWLTAPFVEQLRCRHIPVSCCTESPVIPFMPQESFA